MVEKNIINLIIKHYPQHNIIGEETGKIKSKSNFTWIIDPIDGTKAYTVGIPVFGVLIALKYKSKIILGLVDQPILKERFWNNSKCSFLIAPGLAEVTCARTCRGDLRQDLQK